jgi:hypothetical protein
MRGDMGMLAGTCEKWYTMDIPEYMITRCSQVKIRNYLGLNEFILAGVDFHCFPTIIKKIGDKHPDIKPDDIKRSIWIMSSSLNYRLPKEPVSNEIISTFNKIKMDYREIAKRLLANCY